MTPRTKVGWRREADLLRLKNAVFFGYWGRRLPGLKQATVFVLGVIS
jgi:hypothetical protein